MVYNFQERVVVGIAIAVSFISLLCTFTNLYLIRIMRKWNGYLAIIASMCCCQIIYDVSFAMHIAANDGGTAVAVLNGLQFFGGMSVSIWTNILAVIILRVVVSMKSTDIIQNLLWLSLVAMLPSTILAVLIVVMNVAGTQQQIYDIEELYYWARLASISVNFVVHGIIEYRSYRMRSQRAVSMRTPQEIAIKVLAQRMIYYPLMQTISRIGASIYEARYGFGPFLGHTSTTQYGLACFYVALSPATGIGYLFIFLLMQPYAMDQLRSIVRTGSSIDPLAMELRKRNFRRSSYMHRQSALNRATGGGSESGRTGSSLTTPSDMNNHTSSLSGPTSSTINPQQEEEDLYYFMDDEELVNTIQRVESKSLQPHPTYSVSEMTVNTHGTGITTTNPIYNESTDTYSATVASAMHGVVRNANFNEEL